MEWCATKERAARKFDPGKVEERLDRQLRRYQHSSGIRRARQHSDDADERVRITYADGIRARNQFTDSFEERIREEIFEVERAERQQQNVCRNCGKELETVNEEGKIISNLTLLIANEHYSTWDIVCKHCGTVIRTIPALELMLLLSEIFGRTTRQKLMGEQLRQQGLLQKQKRKFQNYKNRLERERHDDWKDRNPERASTYFREYYRDYYNRQKLSVEIERLLVKVDPTSIIYHDFMLYLNMLKGKHKWLDREVRKQIVQDAQNWFEKRTTHQHTCSQDRKSHGPSIVSKSPQTSRWQDREDRSARCIYPTGAVWNFIEQTGVVLESNEDHG